MSSTTEAGHPSPPERDEDQVVNEEFFESIRNMKVEGSRKKLEQLIRNHGTDLLNRQDPSNGYTALHYAIKENQFAMMKLLLEQGADPDVHHKVSSPLSLACSMCKIEATNILLQHRQKIDVNKLDNDTGYTPLHTACQNGFDKIVVKLLDVEGIDINARTACPRGLTPLHIAAQAGHQNIARLLLSKAKNLAIDIVNSKDRHSRTPLYYAIEEKKDDMAKFLLERHASVRELNIQLLERVSSETIEAAVLCAIWDKQIKFVQDVANHTGTKYCCSVDPEGNTPLHVAASLGYQEIVAILLKAKPLEWVFKKTVKVDASNREGETPLHLAVQCGGTRAVTELLNCKASIYAVRADRMTPIHIAAKKGYPDIIELLLKLNCASVINKEDKRDCTPLRYAIESGKDRIVELLLQRGAKLRGVDFNDLRKFSGSLEYAVLQAAEEGCADFLQGLTHETGTKYCLKDSDGNNALHIATTKGHSAVVDVLLKAKPQDQSHERIEVDAKNSEGKTALILAVEGKHEFIVQMLVEHGADVCITTRGGMAPIHIAAQEGCTGVAEILLKYKEDIINHTDETSHNGTPLLYALKSKRKSMVKLLLQRGVVLKDSDVAEILHGSEDDDLVKEIVIQAVKDNNAGFMKALTEQSGLKYCCFLCDHTSKKTPLHTASSLGCSEVVDVILNAKPQKSQKIDIDAKSKNDSTPLHLAVEGGFLACVETLLTHKANISAVQKDGLTPIHIAAEKGFTEIVNILLQKKSDLINDRAGKVRNHTPLYFATTSNQSGMVKFLLQRGADLDALDEATMRKCSDAIKGAVLQAAQENSDTSLKFLKALTDKTGTRFCFSTDEEANTALHIAAKNGCSTIVNVLLEARPWHYSRKIDPVNALTMTPLHLAVEGGHHDIVKMLLKHGASAVFTQSDGIAPVHIAAQNGFVDIAESLLQHRPETIQSKDKAGHTPLYYAAANNQSEMVKLLLEKGARLKGLEFDTLRDCPGALECIVFYAAKEDCAELLQKLIPAIGMKYCYCTDSKGNTPLHIAAREGFCEVVEILIKTDHPTQHPGLINAENEMGKTPLILAVEGGKVKIVNVLLRHGANIFAVTKAGLTPMHTAAKNGCVEVAEVLLQKEAGAISIEHPKMKRTPLFYAVQSKKSDMVLFLLKRGADWRDLDAQTLFSKQLSDDCITNIMFLAIKNNKVDFLNTFLQQTTSIKYTTKTDSSDKEGNTLLHVAAMQGNDAVIDVLLRPASQTIHRSRPVDKKNKCGATALHLAVERNHKSTVAKLLQQHAANIDAERSDGMTAIHIAAQEGLTEVAEVLLEHKESIINSKNKDHQTPLHLAARHKQGGVIKLLLQRGANLNGLDFQYLKEYPDILKYAVLQAAQENLTTFLEDLISNTGTKYCSVTDSKQNTPLHIAAREGFNHVANILLKTDLTSQEADIQKHSLVNSKNEDDKTPLHLATENNKAQMVEFLLQHGATVDGTTKEGLAPIHIAAQGGFTEVAEVLLKHRDDIINSKDTEQNFTPVYHAANHRKMGAVKLFLQKGANWRDIKMDILIRCDRDIIQDIVLLAVKENAADFLEGLTEKTGIKYCRFTESEKNTPLHIAASFGHSEVIAVLLNAKPQTSQNCAWLMQEVPIDAKNISGKTPLHLCVEGGHTAAVQVLVQKGADIHAVQSNGMASIHIAAQKGLIEVANILVQKQIDVINCKDEKAFTPLHYAGRHQRSKMVIFLLQKGAHLNTLNFADLKGCPESFKYAILQSAQDNCATLLQTAYIVHADAVRISVEEAMKIGLQLHDLIEEAGTEYCNYTDTRGNTPLHIAARENFCEVVDVLLKASKQHPHHISIDAQNDDCETPLHLSIQGGQVKIVQWMLQHGADIHATTKLGMAPIHIAAIKGSIEVAEILLQKDDLINIKDKDKEHTPIYHAAKHEKSEMVNFLLQRGASWRDLESDVDIILKGCQDDVIRNIVMRAVTDNCADFVQSIVHDTGTKYCCLPDPDDPEKNTPLHIAARRGHHEVTEVLLRAVPQTNVRPMQRKVNVNAKNNESDTSLHLAIEGGHTITVKKLLEFKADPRAVRTNGMAPIHITAQKGCIDIAELLLQTASADDIINSKTKDNFSPIQYAGMHKQGEMVKILLQRGASLKGVKFMTLKNCPDAYEDAILRAAQENCDEFLQALTSETGTTYCCCTDSKLNTPLHIAAQLGHSEVVDVILKAQPQESDPQQDILVDSKNEDGKTPLLLAAESNYASIVDVLLQHGADIHAVTADGMAAIHIAAKNEFIEVARVLLAKDCSVISSSNDQDSNHTPLYYAGIHRRSQIVKNFLKSGANWKDLDAEIVLNLQGSVIRDIVFQAVREENSAEFLQIIISETGMKHCHQPDPDDVDRNTPLHIAAGLGYHKIVAVLLETETKYVSPSVPRKVSIDAKNSESDTPLHLAIEKGHTTTVEKLLQHGADIYAARADGMAPIHIAAQRGYTPIAHQILQQQSGIDIVNDRDKKAALAPIQYAGMNKQSEMVKFLLLRGASLRGIEFKILQECDDALETAVLKAAEENCVKFLQDLTNETGTKYCHCANPQKNTALHTAAQLGLDEVVSVLLNAKPQEEDGSGRIEIDAQNGEANTPLLLAAKGEHSNTVQMLLQKGANIHATNSEGIAAIHIAAQLGCIELAKILLEQEGDIVNSLDSGSTNRTPLYHAAHNGKSKMAKLLLHRGAKWSDLDVPTVLRCEDDVIKDVVIQAVGDNRADFIQELSQKTGTKFCYFTDHSDCRNTPLHTAAKLGNDKVAAVLLQAKPQKGEKRVPVNAVNAENETPLHLAAENGHATTVEMLLDESANIHATISSTGMSAIHIAARNGCTSVATILVEKGNTSIVNVEDKAKLTPLHYAAKHNHLDMITFLLGKSADLNAIDENNSTPLMTAAENGNETAFQKMVECGDEKAVFDNFFQAAKESTNARVLQYFARNIKFSSSKDKDANTPLHVAAINGNEKAVEVFMKVEGIDFGIKNKDGKTPMHLAAERNQTQIVELLLKLPNDHLMVRDAKEMTPLHHACQEGHTKVVEVLSNNGKLSDDVVGAPGSELNTPLHLACEGENIRIVELLVDSVEKDIINSKNARGEAALHIAAQYGSEQVAATLLKKEANIESKDAGGCTPLHIAARHGRRSMIDFLLKRDNSELPLVGAKPDALDNNSYTPLLTAAAYGRVDAVQCLMDPDRGIIDIENPKKNPAFLALSATHGEVAILKLLIGDPHWGKQLCKSLDHDLNTPLHIAASDGKLAAVKVLLEGEIQIRHEKNSCGKTPMHLAAENGRVRVVSELIRYQQNTELEDNEGNTPLHLACEEGHDGVIPILNKSNPKASNNQKNTPLHLACGSGNYAAAKALIKTNKHLMSDDDIHTAVNAKNEQNQTPLTLACQLPHLKIILYLIQNGADVATTFDAKTAEFLKSESGWNYLDWAIEKRHRAVAFEIVRCPKWKAAMKNCPDRVTTPMRRMIEKMPEVAEKVLERSWDKNRDFLTLNYEFLEDFRSPPLQRESGFCADYVVCRSCSSDVESGGQLPAAIQGQSHTMCGENDWGPDHFEKSNHILSIMVKNGCTNLLQHRLVKDLRCYKWKKYGMYFFAINLMIYLSFLTCLTTFAVIVPTPLDRACIPTNTTESSDCAGINHYSSTYVCAVLVIILSIFRLGMEIIQLVILRKQYLKNVINWLEVVLFVFSIAFASVFGSNCLCVTSGQWQIGILAVFLGWATLIIFLRKLPWTGVYVLMLEQIIYSFLKLVPLAALLILTFGLTVYMLFNEPNQERTPFATPALALAKTMMMTTGELEYGDNFRQNDEEEEIPYPVLSFPLWIIFVIVMPILFANLLTGIAVDDVQSIRQDATIKRIELEVELLLSFEELLPAKYRTVVIPKGTVNRFSGSYAHQINRALCLPCHKCTTGEENDVIPGTQAASTHTTAQSHQHQEDSESDSEQVPDETRQQFDDITSIKMAVTELSQQYQELENLMKQLIGRNEVLESFVKRIADKQER